MPTILGPANTYSTTVTGGTGYPGDEATGHGMREFVSYIDNLEPWNTSFYSRLKRGPSVWKSKVEWGVRKQLPHTVTLAAAMTNVQTTIVLVTGHGQRLMPGTVLYIPEDVTGNAPEIVWLHNTLSTRTTDTWDNVVRAQGGTTGVAHDNSTVCQVIGVAVPDMADHPEAPIQFGDLFFNRRQRFPKKITVDSAEDIQRDWENQQGGNFEIRLEQAARQIKLEFEKALILGRRQDGAPDPTPANKRPSLMSGLEHFAVLSTNTYDLAGALLNYYDFEEVLRDGWNEIDANFGDTFMMNMNTKSIFDTIINIKRRADAETTMLDLRMEKVRFSSGTVNILINRYVPDEMILAFRFQDLAQHPYTNLDWHFARKKPGIDTDGDYSIGSISSDRTFVAEAPATLAVVTDFNADISAYPVDLAV